MLWLCSSPPATARSALDLASNLSASCVLRTAHAGSYCLCNTLLFVPNHSSLPLPDFQRETAFSHWTARSAFKHLMSQSRHRFVLLTKPRCGPRKSTHPVEASQPSGIYLAFPLLLLPMWSAFSAPLAARRVSYRRSAASLSPHARPRHQTRPIISALFAMGMGAATVDSANASADQSPGTAHPWTALGDPFTPPVVAPAFTWYQ